MEMIPDSAWPIWGKKGGGGGRGNNCDDSDGNENDNHDDDNDEKKKNNTETLKNDPKTGRAFQKQIEMFHKRSKKHSEKKNLILYNHDIEGFTKAMYTAPMLHA